MFQPVGSLTQHTSPNVSQVLEARRLMTLDNIQRLRERYGRLAQKHPNLMDGCFEKDELLESLRLYLEARG